MLALKKKMQILKNKIKIHPSKHLDFPSEDFPPKEKKQLLY